MSRLNDKSESKQDFSTVKFREIAILEEFLELSTMSCALISTWQSLRLRLLKCIANWAGNKGILLFSSVSVSKVILLYNSRVVPGHRLMSCQQIDGRSFGKFSLIDHSQCIDYRSQQKSNLNVYPELSVLEQYSSRKNELFVYLHSAV